MIVYGNTAQFGTRQKVQFFAVTLSKMLGIAPLCLCFFSRHARNRSLPCASLTLCGITLLKIQLVFAGREHRTAIPIMKAFNF